MKIHYSLAKTPVQNFADLLIDVGYTPDILKEGFFSAHTPTAISGVGYFSKLANTEVTVSMVKGGFERLTMEQPVVVNASRVPTDYEAIKAQLLSYGLSQEEVAQLPQSGEREETTHKYRRLDLLKELTHNELRPVYIEEKYDAQTNQFTPIDLSEVEAKIHAELDHLKFPRQYYRLSKDSEFTYVTSASVTAIPTGEMLLCAIDSGIYTAKQINLQNAEVREIYTPQFIKDKSATVDNRMHNNPATAHEYTVVGIPSVNFSEPGSKLQTSETDTVSAKFAAQFTNKRKDVFNQMFANAFGLNGTQGGLRGVPYAIVAERLTNGDMEEMVPDGKVAVMAPESFKWPAPTEEEDLVLYYKNHMNQYYAPRKSVADYFDLNAIQAVTGTETDKVTVLRYSDNPYYRHNAAVMNKHVQVVGRGHVFVIPRMFSEFVDEFVEEFNTGDKNILVTNYTNSKGSDTDYTTMDKINAANTQINRMTSVTSETTIVDGTPVKTLTFNADQIINKSNKATEVFTLVVEGLQKSFGIPVTTPLSSAVVNEEDKTVTIKLTGTDSVQGDIIVKLVFGEEVRVSLLLDGFDMATGEDGSVLSNVRTEVEEEQTIVIPGERIPIYDENHSEIVGYHELSGMVVTIPGKNTTYKDGVVINAGGQDYVLSSTGDNTFIGTPVDSGATETSNTNSGEVDFDDNRINGNTETEFDVSDHHF